MHLLIALLLAATGAPAAAIDLDACDRAYAPLHEVGHFLHRPSHTGPTAYCALAEVPCGAQRIMQQRLEARWLAERSPAATAWWPR